MENLMISATNNAPEINFRVDGHFVLKGRIITENAVTTFAPLFEWIPEFSGKNVLFDINLDYINTSATMQLFAFLRILDENSSIDTITVRWFYEIDDEDHRETGEYYKEKLTRTKFEYVQSIEYK